MGRLARLPSVAAVAAALAVAACWGDTDTAERYPDTSVFGLAADLPEDVGGDGASQCRQRCLDGIEDAVYRITLLHVTEPADDAAPAAKPLRDLLNDMWATDIEHYVLNILFDMQTADPATGAITLDVGPGWYRLTDEAAATQPKMDDVTGDDVKDFCLLKGIGDRDLHASFGMQLAPDCAFDIDARDEEGEGKFLLFHTGPADAPVICAPEQGQTPGLAANTIPLSITVANGRLDSDCTHIIDGYLAGCIAFEHADRICMCTKDEHACPMDPQPGAKYYCEEHCGPSQLNFGAFAQKIAKLPANCQVMGLDGMRLAGRFEAVRLEPEQVNPVRSMNCRGE